MKMSEEMAVRLHRMMWSDMQKELGDNPGPDYRIRFKEDWVSRMFPDESVVNCCWLCHYTEHNCSEGIVKCSRCPIKWPMEHCNVRRYSYLTMPISEILALPARNESVVKKAESIHDLSRDIVVCEVAKASGLPVECDIWTHIKKIQNKEQDVGFKTAKNELAVHSGLDVDATLWEHIRAIRDGNHTFKAVKKTLSEASGIESLRPVEDHIKAIQEKAVYEYFAKTPGAKLAMMDVDNAFKQYADEQKAPIFKELSKASGLSEHNHAVLDHIAWIKLKGDQDIYRALKEEKASIFKELAAESGLDPTATVKAHMNAIYSKGKEAGATEEQERIMDKIREMFEE